MLFMQAPYLPQKRGSYETYKGSLWSQGVFPIDSYNNLMVYRGQQKTPKEGKPLTGKGQTFKEWQKIRESCC